MRSKLFSLLLISTVLVSCGLKMGEKKEVNDIAEVQSAKCLDTSIAQIKLYFAGDATDDQASSSFQCMQDVLIAFKDNIRGANQDVYTPEEIAQFIEKNFVKDGSKFSSGFLTEFMKFKVAFIGGDIHFIHKDEIRKVVDILARLTPDLVRLNKSMKIVTFKWNSGIQPKEGHEKENQFLAAQASLAKVINRITAQFAQQNSSYSVDDIVSFAKEISIFAKLGLVTTNSISKFYGVAGKVKLALLGGDAALKNQEWMTLGTALNEGLFQYLRYKYFIHDLSDEQKTETWLQIDKIANGTVALVNYLLDGKSTHVITTDEVVNVVDQMIKNKILSADLHSENFRLALNALWGNLLINPENRIQGKVLPGLNAEAMQTVAKHVLSTIHAQQSVAEIFEAKPELKPNEIHVALQSITEGPTVSPELQKSLDELSQVLNSKVALTFNEQNFLKILTDDADVYHYKDILFANLARAASKLFIEAYALDIARVTELKGLTQAEAETAFASFKGLAIDFDAVDPKTAATFISSRFREANLFLTSSNGDQYANFSELHDIVLHIVSGISRANVVKKSIAAACLPAGTTDLTSGVAVPEDCLINVYLNETAAFADMPQFLNLKNQFSADLLKDYYMSLLKAAGHVPNDKKVVYLGDANLFPHVIQYIEMIYASFDTSKDNLLVKDEALVAFPIFHDTIKQVAGVKEEQLQGTFIYLLKYGRQPKTLAEKLAFAAFVGNPDKWIINTTRLDLGKIFNFIADATKPTTPTPPPPPPPPANP